MFDMSVNYVFAHKYKMEQEKKQRQWACLFYLL